MGRVGGGGGDQTPIAALGQLGEGGAISRAGQPTRIAS